jgi:multidrug efflux system membrane fusion protein
LTATRKILGWLISIAALAAFAWLGLLAHARIDSRPRTDDAYLQADLVHLAPDVSGRIVSFNVRNNQAVRAGDLLFTIDPEPFKLQADQARAQVLGLEGQLAITSNQVGSQISKADAANTGIGSAQAQLALATSTLARLEPLLPQGFVTAEQVDQARATRRTAELTLQQARQQAQEARQGVASIKPTEQQLAAARAALALAERNLRLTVTRAPCDGLITGLDTASGEFAAAGHPLFTLIDTQHWYAVGNFRETELAALHPGQRATIYVMAAPQTPLGGKIESLGWGVSPDEGVTIGGLPRVPRSLSWVRIAQRFPVRIVVDKPPPALMRVGASAVIVIDR